MNFTWWTGGPCVLWISIGCLGVTKDFEDRGREEDDVDTGRRATPGAPRKRSPCACPSRESSHAHPQHSRIVAKCYLRQTDVRMPGPKHVPKQAKRPSERTAGTAEFNCGGEYLDGCPPNEALDTAVAT